MSEPQAPADPVATTRRPVPPGTGLGAQMMAAALSLPLSLGAQAQTPPERASLSLKYLDYLDSQPGADRIRVKAPSLQLVLPLSADWALGATAITDSISGASPAYHGSALTRLTDFRRAGTLSLSRYVGRASLTLGASGSSERDYLSRSVFLQASVATEDRNTTVSVGLAGTRDVINPTTRIVEDERKRVNDLLLTLTQVLTPSDIVQANLGYSRGNGYFSDPYKVLDNRPRERHHTTVLVRWNHHVERTDGVVRLSWRHYRDTFGIRAQTMGAEYVQPLGRGWSVMPLLRYHTQSAARFYIDVDPDAGPFGPAIPEGAQYTTLDHRLSAFGALTAGVKVSWRVDDHWLLDAKFEQYGQRGRWKLGGGGSPGLPAFNARSLQLGFTRQF